MKKNLPALYCLFFAPLFSLSVSAQTVEPCKTEVKFNEYAQKDPSLIIARNAFDDHVRSLLPASQNITETPRIIPVVFHVIHQGGSENISKAQIQDQVRILNEDYRRMNPDTVNTPAPYKARGADCNIEFRIAHKDPNGNCTDGIERIYSRMTENADDNVKAFSVWPRSKYLNIWVVKSIAGSSQTAIILGYSQFPGGSASTDGVIIRSDYVGSIGTAAGNGYFGRSMTHEVGHWLGLRHIWADDNGGCSQDDNVSDTPKQSDKNYGCPTFPHVSCTNGPNGDLFSDYMDYSEGQCQNIFTSGQKAVMDYALAGSRSSVIASSNLIATGTNGTAAVACVPIADFTSSTRFICTGTNVTLNDASYNADTLTYNWTFTGANLTSSTIQNPVVQYATPGDYPVSLTVTNSAGSNTKTKNSFIHVSGGSYFSAPFFNDYEANIALPALDEYIVNDDNGTTWQHVTNAGYSGTSSVMISNFNNNYGEYDDYILPAYNFTHLGTPIFLKFRVAYAQKSSDTDDNLKVFVSTNCGQNWTQKYSKVGSTLATAGIKTSNFVPTTSQWRLDSINLGAYHNLSKVRFMFENISAAGNNIYLDDINITGIVGMEETIAANLEFNIYPNPTSDLPSVISFQLINPQDVSIELFDMTGRKIQQVEAGRLKSGVHHYSIDTKLGEGIYIVKLSLGNQLFTKKLVVTDRH